jgi:hypothetical protein
MDKHKDAAARNHRCVNWLWSEVGRTLSLVPSIGRVVHGSLGMGSLEVCAPVSSLLLLNAPLLCPLCVCG